MVRPGRHRATIVVACIVPVAACGGDQPTAAPTTAATTAPTIASTLPLAEEALDDPEVTTVATDLARSQIGASTVPEPPTPGPCPLDALALWTARVEPSADGVAPSTVDAVIRVRNVGAEWCEPDIGRSPLLDPAVEPDVWLRPGDEADLRVGQQSADCGDPTVVSLVQVAIGDESTVVPSAVVTCGWWLNAFAPLDPPERRCDPADLEVVVTDRAVVLRTVGPACGIGGLEFVTDGATVAGGELPASPVRVLHPGDVAMIAVLDRECDAAPAPATIEFAGTGEVVVDDVPCSARWIVGPPHPWFGSADGPLAGTGGPTADPESVVAALDPFGVAGRSVP